MYELVSSCVVPGETELGCVKTGGGSLTIHLHMMHKNANTTLIETYEVFDCDFGFNSQEWSCS